MARNDTPDLLASMFGDKKRKPETVKQAPPSASLPTPEEVPLRCTHYLTRQTAAQMPMAQGQILQLTTLQKRDVSNSNLVEAALRMALADLEAYGENSEFVRLLRQIASEQ